MNSEKNLYFHLQKSLLNNNNNNNNNNNKTLFSFSYSFQGILFSGFHLGKKQI